MDRRKFVGLSSISFLGFNGIAQAGNTLLNSKNIEDISPVLSLIGNECPLNQLTLQEKEVISNVKKSLISNAYADFTEEKFWATNTHILIPQELAVNGEIHDLLILVFRKVHTSLEYTGMLSGFHLEVLSKHLPELNQQIKKGFHLQDIILPAGEKKFLLTSADSFQTRLGYFRLQPVISEGFTKVNSQLVVEHDEIWNVTYYSNHGLYYKNSIFA